MSPDLYCQQRAAASGSSTYYSFLFLPSPRRRAITALYAFCREVDDTVDECADMQLAQAKLAWWRIEVANLFDRHPQHPVTRALEPAIEQFGITAGYLNEIIDGVAMDITQSRYLDFVALEHYCYRVSGVVAILSAGIFGNGDRATLEYATNLGLAFQLTRIICEVGEDARRNRIYLPMDELRRHGVAAADVLNCRYSDAFAGLMREQSGRARSYYRTALEALAAQDRRDQRPGLIMAAINCELLDVIEADGFKVLTQRTSLTPMRMLWIAWKTWILA